MTPASPQKSLSNDDYVRIFNMILDSEPESKDEDQKRKQILGLISSILRDRNSVEK